MSVLGGLKTSLSTYSLAGLLLFGIIIALFITIISDFLTYTFTTLYNATSLIANKSKTYSIGDKAVNIPEPQNNFTRTVVNSITWIVLGLLKIISDPIILALTIMITAIIAIITTEGMT